jgi:hypothetical protein
VRKARERKESEEREDKEGKTTREGREYWWKEEVGPNRVVVSFLCTV